MMLPFNFQNYNTAVTGLNNGILYEIIKGKLATTSMSENGPLDPYEGWGPNKQQINT